MIIVKTPLRISLFGGGSDFPEYFQESPGKVITTAINKYVYVILKRRFDNFIRLGYSQTEIVEDAKDLKHEIAREALLVFKNKGIEISTMSDIPSHGTGLGSSSAVTVGLIQALSEFNNYHLSCSELANHAIDIEVDRLKKKIGFQDQIVTAYGGFINIDFNSKGINIDEKNRDEFFVKNVITPFDNSLMLFYTGKQRQANDILVQQVENMGHNRSIISEMVDIAILAKAEIDSGNVYRLGNLLDQSWTLKKLLAMDITNEHIDDLYDYALKNGAIGGKICGAGGGGFLLLQAPIEKQEKLRDAMKVKGITELAFNFECYGSRVIFRE